MKEGLRQISLVLGAEEGDVSDLTPTELHRDIQSSLGEFLMMLMVSF